MIVCYAVALAGRLAAARDAHASCRVAATTHSHEAMRPTANLRLARALDGAAAVDGDPVRPAALGDRRVAAHSVHRTLVGLEPEPIHRGRRAGAGDTGLLRVSARTAIEGHLPAHHVVEPADGALQIGFVRAILENAILQEFIPFIVLLFSLFTISGGIRITGDLQAHPMTNATFLAVGGAAGELHRHDRRGDAADSPAAGNQQASASTSCTRSCFSFSSCATAAVACCRIGDPPLFLGYLQGVPLCGRWCCGRNGCSSTGC